MQNQGKRDFDAAAAGWDEEPRRVKLAQEVVTVICRELPLATEMEALDYGCGSGLVTLGLQPFVGRITGADSSQGMLQVLSRKVRERGITNVVAKFIDLEQQRLDGSYDLIVSSMTLHHVHNVAALIGSFVQILNPGGWLALADLESEDGSFHDDSTGVYHRGFDREFFSSVCSRNSLTDIRIITAATIDKSKGSGGRRLYPVLLCLARKRV
ncbi:MAG: methyltransferase type 11 [Geobacteraceae bacterium GWC2_58_44]|nr:MAG: methyltransferase type 11 [Geobacteraceae bacterium GWC2_58_44]HBG04078.1 class I SAM-dependent methyltransferase [Geobacter sp.]